MEKIKELVNKANILLEALPYIKKFSNDIMVVKIGGEPMIDDTLKNNIALDIILMKYVGINVVVLHGGGKQISNLMHKLGKKAVFINGLRVTDKETMEITEMVLTGMINKDLVGVINKNGGEAVGISGRDGNLIVSKKKSDNKDDLGYVGDINKINPKIIKTLIDNGFIPVISPVSVGPGGEAFNINADTAAGSIAAALNASKLIILSDVRGIYKDINNSKTFMPTITLNEIKNLTEKNIIQKGMLPKVNACINSLSNGTSKAHIIDGKIQHSLLLEIFTEAGVGTEIILK